MLYDQFIKLMNLKPCKWYNFIKKYKNYKLIYDVFFSASAHISTNWSDNNKINLLLEFAQCVNALEPLVSNDVTKIKVYGLNDNENRAYGCSGNIITMEISNNIICLPVEIKLYKNESMMVTYTYNRFKINKFMFSTDADMATLSSSDQFIMSQIYSCINIYLKTVTEFLVNKYT